MNQKLFSHVAVPLLLTAVSLPLVSDGGVSETAEPVTSSTSQQPTPEGSPVPMASELDAPTNVIKLGERGDKSSDVVESTIVARVQAHDLEGREAATVYVKNIPVLTFVGASTVSDNSVKLGARASASDQGSKSLMPSVAQAKPNAEPLSADSDAPMMRATSVAAKLNKLNREVIDASTITVSWDGSRKAQKAGGERYLIKAGETVLVAIDSSTILSGSTRNLEQDALQAANRLRRLLGNVSPLSSVSGKPKPPAPVAVRLVERAIASVNGWASWYGPGFHGNLSASGEVFDQNALTAAHRTLPFGTRVRVTNLNNGYAVVVRINDRGPFHGDRIIDVSARAAGILGLVDSGVAPVKVDILNR
jgi:rare lipoprotein A